MPKKNLWVPVGFQLKTMTTLSSTALSITSTNCTTKTTPEKIVCVARVQVADHAVHIAYGALTMPCIYSVPK